MFTGIVLNRGRIEEARREGEGLRLVVALGAAGEGARSGDSIAVAGTCLTLAGEPADGRGTFFVVRETLDLTTLGSLGAGAEVNLEPALRVGDRLGGHMVQGHVDGVGRVRKLEGKEGAVTLSIAAPEDLRPWLVHKGSITVDGVSLTVASVDTDGFTIALIPQTLGVTTLGNLKPGDAVNLEADQIGKWVKRILDHHPPRQQDS